MDANNTITKPLPGPAMVTYEPPKTETTIPPATAEIIPANGGASEAIARPKPKGNAIKETTKPENTFCGSVFKESEKDALLLIFMGLNDENIGR